LEGYKLALKALRRDRQERLKLAHGLNPSLLERICLGKLKDLALPKKG
jgi:hypothetical protein